MKTFRYTQNVGILTEEQRQFYEENGYIVIKNNVSDELLDKARKRFIDICDGKGDSSVKIVTRDPYLMKKGAKGEYVVNKLQDCLYDDVLFEYAAAKTVTDIVASIIGPNITACNLMILNKPPNSDPKFSLHPLHQDLHYFPFRPADRIVGSWTAMEKVDEKNGCLFVVPGSHKGKLYPHTYPKGITNKMYHGVHGMDHLPKINLIMDKGDTVFFHPLLLHGSGPNSTNGFRKAISCHYADTNCNFIDVKGTLQDNIGHEVEEVFKKKFGFSASYSDIWKAKSRLVKGPSGNFQNMSSHL